MGRIDNWTSLVNRFYQWRESPNDGPGSIAALIAERPISIVIVRQNTTTQVKTVLPAQTVRVDLDSGLRAIERTSASPSSALTVKQKIIVLGYLNDRFIDDTDLAFGDTFLYDGQQFVIRQIQMGFTDRILAQAEATD